MKIPFLPIDRQILHTWPFIDKQLSKVLICNEFNAIFLLPVYVHTL